MILRRLIKTLTWRGLGSGATFLVAWIITGQVVISGTIAAIQIVVNTVLYYAHEWLWDQVPRPCQSTAVLNQSAGVQPDPIESRPSCAESPAGAPSKTAQSTQDL